MIAVSKGNECGSMDGMHPLLLAIYKNVWNEIWEYWSLNTELMHIQADWENIWFQPLLPLLLLQKVLMKQSICCFENTSHQKPMGPGVCSIGYFNFSFCKKCAFSSAKKWHFEHPNLRTESKNLAKHPPKMVGKTFGSCVSIFGRVSSQILEIMFLEPLGALFTLLRGQNRKTAGRFLFMGL